MTLPEFIRCPYRYLSALIFSAIR